MWSTPFSQDEFWYMFIMGRMHVHAILHSQLVNNMTRLFLWLGAMPYRLNCFWDVDCGTVCCFILSINASMLLWRILFLLGNIRINFCSYCYRLLSKGHACTKSQWFIWPRRQGPFSSPAHIYNEPHNDLWTLTQMC